MFDIAFVQLTCHHRICFHVTRVKVGMPGLCAIQIAHSHLMCLATLERILERINVTDLAHISVFCIISRTHAF